MLPEYLETVRERCSHRAPEDWSRCEHRTDIGTRKLPRSRVTLCQSYLIIEVITADGDLHRVIDEVGCAGVDDSIIIQFDRIG